MDQNLFNNVPNDPDNFALRWSLMDSNSNSISDNNQHPENNSHLSISIDSNNNNSAVTVAQCLPQDSINTLFSNISINADNSKNSQINLSTIMPFVSPSNQLSPIYSSKPNTENNEPIENFVCDDSFSLSLSHLSNPFVSKTNVNAIPELTVPMANQISDINPTAMQQQLFTRNQKQFLEYPYSDGANSNSNLNSAYSEPIFPVAHRNNEANFPLPTSNTSQIFKDQKALYSLIIAQLLHDGYEDISQQLLEKFPNDYRFSLIPNNVLHTLVSQILTQIDTKTKTETNYPSTNNNTELILDQSPINNRSDFNHDSTDENGNDSLKVSKDCQKLKAVSKFGAFGTGPGCLDMPHGFCIGLNDDIVIADTNNHRISIFSLQGDFRFSFGEKGTHDGQLFQPRKVAMLPPTILNENENPLFVVCDRGSKRSRMQLFSVNGKFIRLINIPFMDIVSGLTTTQDRKIVAVDSVRSGVLIMDEEGGIKNWFTCSPHMIEPSDIALHNQHFFICDFKGHCVNVFNHHGVMMRKITSPLIKFPNGIDISDDGDIIVGDSHGNRFHVSLFNENGSLFGDFECPFLKVSRCCGLKLTREGYIVTLAKNNNHVLIMSNISV